jgi:hypothetical protein
MRELSKEEIAAVSGGDINQVGACRTDSAEKFVKTIVVAVAGYLRDLWR